MRGVSWCDPDGAHPPTPAPRMKGIQPSARRWDIRCMLAQPQKRVPRPKRAITQGLLPCPGKMSAWARGMEEGGCSKGRGGWEGLEAGHQKARQLSSTCKPAHVVLVEELASSRGPTTVTTMAEPALHRQDVLFASARSFRRRLVPAIRCCLVFAAVYRTGLTAVCLRKRCSAKPAEAGVERPRTAGLRGARLRRRSRLGLQAPRRGGAGDACAEALRLRRHVQGHWSYAAVLCKLLDCQ